VLLDQVRVDRRGNSVGVVRTLGTVVVRLRPRGRSRSGTTGTPTAVTADPGDLRHGLLHLREEARRRERQEHGGEHRRGQRGHRVAREEDLKVS